MAYSSCLRGLLVLEAASLLDLVLDEVLELIDDGVRARLVAVSAPVAATHNANLKHILSFTFATII